MPAPRTPPDEAERLRLLESLDLLDTDAEEVFDRITRLVSRLLKVPYALFSLVDSERQYFKSRVGTAERALPREHAFCGHAIVCEQPLVVTDAASDPRFADNPFVTGSPGIRFYAGVPIRSAGGLAIGTLCAMGVEPRVLTADELCVLIDLADIVQHEVQTRERLAQAGRQKRHSAAVLDASEARFRSIFDLASIGIALLSPDGAWTSVNGALCSILGYTREELQRLRFQDITHPDDLAGNLQSLERLCRGEVDQYQVEKRYIRKDGRPVWVDVHVSRKRNEAGATEYYIAVATDIQDQKDDQAKLAALYAELEERVAVRTRELREREAELRSVIENANDAYIGLDHQGLVAVWNRAAEDTFGYTAPEAIGRALGDLIIPAHLAGRHRAGLARSAAGEPSTVLGKRLELPAVRKDGSTLMVEVRINALEMRGKKVFSAFLHDISERKQAEALREYESRHDMLTGLLNRRALLETLPVAQGRASRTGRSMALLFIDLDGFKLVNDTWGHEAGDRLLCEVAARLRDAVRKTDSVFRLAGDEFTVLVEGLADCEEDAHAIADKAIEALGRPFAVAGAVARVGASVGIAMFAPGSHASVDDLLREADGHMYDAKRAGKGQVYPRRKEA